MGIFQVFRRIIRLPFRKLPGHFEDGSLGVGDVFVFDDHANELLVVVGDDCDFVVIDADFFREILLY